MLAIERELGRKRNPEKTDKTYENRPIDIDLLFYGDEIKIQQNFKCRIRACRNGGLFCSRCMI